ncbi:hypothetical protein J2Z66_004679 [Paenibacillus eucommiae]|uniref:Uncharacterized protein n=1 Tax=Paenibacillus eucommiae TaxID=1355755 RepID=A0ABS4IZQ4_9BACL|nr:hypothetical protein [Paenibacillus eucommiae]
MKNICIPSLRLGMVLLGVPLSINETITLKTLRYLANFLFCSCNPVHFTAYFYSAY